MSHQSAWRSHRKAWTSIAMGLWLPAVEARGSLLPATLQGLFPVPQARRAEACPFVGVAPRALVDGVQPQHTGARRAGPPKKCLRASKEGGGAGRTEH